MACLLSSLHCNQNNSLEFSTATYFFLLLLESGVTSLTKLVMVLKLHFFGSFIDVMQYSANVMLLQVSPDHDCKQLGQLARPGR